MVSALFDGAAERADSFDEVVEAAADRLRDRQIVDDVMHALSKAGDEGRIWILAALIEARRRPDPYRWLIRSLVWFGAQAAVVNLAIKPAVRRQRPDNETTRQPSYQTPINSSFPSGHAASAATMAVILSQGAKRPAGWWLLALGIGWSRIHLRVHHGSDVAAGLAIGAAFGAVARHGN